MGSASAERAMEVSAVEQYPWGAFVHFRDPNGNGWWCRKLPLAISGAVRLTATRLAAEFALFGEPGDSSA